MKVLLLAPQPFYQERGTPIAVDLLLRVLSARGEQVDLLTYFEGADLRYPNVRIHRIPRPPFVRRVGPGPSLKKVLCDLVLFVSALRLAARERHDVVHAVEESVFIALVINRCLGIPYVYDMDSSLPDQILDKYPAARPLMRPLRAAEASAIRGAEAVVPVCDALADQARRHEPRHLAVLRDISLLSVGGAPVAAPVDLERELGMRRPLVMYVGNLERYQGIDLLLQSFAIARRQVPEASLVVIGGDPAGVARYQAMARQLGLDGAVRFAGPRPVAGLAGYLAAADVLVSPRLQGGNTPMKVYSYLDSGTAVLATDLPTHTQVLTAEVAMLRPAQPDALAEGLVRLLRDPGLRQRLGQAARRLVRERHSYDAFRATVNALYDGLSRTIHGRHAPTATAAITAESP